MPSRSALVALLVLAGAPADAQEMQTDQRVIANVAQIMKLTMVISNTRLQIISPDRAALIGEEEPTLIARTGRCVFEAKSRSAAGYRIDFNKLDGNYGYQCDGIRCHLALSGAPGAGCLTFTYKADECGSYVRLRASDARSRDDALATVAFVLNNECPVPSRPRPKPRF